MEIQELKSIIESMLFVSGEPVKIARIAKITGNKDQEIENALSELKRDYESGRGLAIVQKEDLVQMVSSPRNSQYVSQLVKGELNEAISTAGLEVLSIIAYRGPISRTQVEMIRGVSSDFTIRKLMMRGLVERIDNPADSRSYLYKISFEFLKTLGISGVGDLPDYEELSRDERIESAVAP